MRMGNYVSETSIDLCNDHRVSFAKNLRKRKGSCNADYPVQPWSGSQVCPDRPALFPLLRRDTLRSAAGSCLPGIAKTRLFSTVTSTLSEETSRNLYTSGHKIPNKLSS